MKEKLNAIATSTNPLITTLENHRSLSSLGKFLMPLRSEKLMRNVTFANEPIDCLLFAIEHLKKGENDLGEALAWLNHAHTAFAKSDHPHFWQELAEVIRLDLMTQLNGLRLTEVCKSKQEASTQLSVAQLDDKAKAKLISTYQLLVGLLGYHLGRDLEINQEAIFAYDKLLSKTSDSALTQLIRQRINALEEHSYLEASDLYMSKDVFDDMFKNKDKLQKFINACCLEGIVPSRPQYEEKIKKSAYELAGLSVFAGPLALVVIPSVLLGTPIFKLIDAVNFRKDQQENEVFYALLDDAHEWIKANIRNQAEQLCPDYPIVVNEIEQLQQKFQQQKLSITDRNLNQKLKDLNDSLLFNKYHLDDDKVATLTNILEEIKGDIEQLDAYENKIRDVTQLAESFSTYLKDTDSQLEFKDGRYHSNLYRNSRYDNVLLKDMPSILHSFEKEFEQNCVQASILANDISARLKNVKIDIKETVSKKKETEHNQKEQADKFEQTLRRNFF